MAPFSNVTIGGIYNR